MRAPRRWRRRHAVTDAGLALETSRVIEMTDARTHRAHLVTDEAAAAGRADAGSYVAVCGVVVLAASLTNPDTSYCSDCRRRNESHPRPARRGIRSASGVAHHGS